MFGKRPPTVVGPETSFCGTIDCGSDDFQIDGRFEGSVSSTAHVVVTAGGQVTGDIHAESITVGGRVEGSVVARDRLHMLATGTVKGDATYGMLEVDRGGVIEGRALHVGGAKRSPERSPDTEPDDAPATTPSTPPASLAPPTMPSSHPPPPNSRETTREFVPSFAAPAPPRRAVAHTGVVVPSPRRAADVEERTDEVVADEGIDEENTDQEQA